ncbi:hypothetical protein SAMN05428981_101221 [Bacillus sp. OV194]|nr:hypothetical protein SAMN05428981_101221 [Bacillus sp. OV194]
MGLKLDEKLIEQFRNAVNNEIFFQEKFKNFKGKNKWNIICSAMDWITVTVDGLPNITLKHAKGLGYNHTEALSLIQYIITIDILTDAIRQLFRVLYGNNTPYPLEDDKSIFNQSKLSDDKYFKHLRAVFGTHQVNLSSVDGVQRHDGERFYASWPTQDPLHKNAFSVFLYSNNPNDDELRPFIISIDEVNMFAETRYNLLTNLIVKVSEINKEHKQRCKQILIPKVDNPIEQLEILFKENQKRFGSNYGYSHTIKNLNRILSVDVDKIKDFDYEIIKKYRNHLISFIPVIRNELQNMKVNHPFQEFYHSGYEFEKIYMYLMDQEHPVGKMYFNKLVDLGILPNYLKTSSDFNLKTLILDALLYLKSCELGKRVNVRDLI